ncbi:MAG: hypothetical protein QXW47_01395 [Candidatus Jordarchaeales archaeon]
MRKRYEKIKVNRRYAWIRKDREDRIKGIEGLIFDCDGVIFDVSRSFREAIMKTVEWFFSTVMGVKVPQINFSHIQMFKDTGAFNNDWELTYAIITYYLTNLLANARKIELKDKCRGDITTTYSFFKELGSFLREIKESGGEDLEKYVEDVGVGGLEAAREKAARRLAEAWKVELDEARKVLEYVSPFEGEVYDENLIKRFFEEAYCGDKLFKEIYGVPAVFYRGKGLIENEKPIVRHKALKEIIGRGFPPIGIASGRMRKQTTPLLEKYRLEEYFDLDASTFLEEIEEKERELRREGRHVKLDKPNPYPLITTASKMRINSFAYVGDTIADVLACLNAETESGCNVVSVGVLCSAENKSEMLSKFLEFGCDVIIPTPNELPKVIGGVRK